MQRQKGNYPKRKKPVGDTKTSSEEKVSVTKPSTELSPKSVTEVSKKRPRSEKSRKKSTKRSFSD